MLCCTSTRAQGVMSTLQFAIENEADGETHAHSGPERNGSNTWLVATWLHALCRPCMHPLQTDTHHNHASTAQHAGGNTVALCHTSTPEASKQSMQRWQPCSLLGNLPCQKPCRTLCSKATSSHHRCWQDRTASAWRGKKFWDTVCIGVLGAHVHSSGSCQISAFNASGWQSTAGNNLTWPCWLSGPVTM